MSDDKKPPSRRGIILGGAAAGAGLLLGGGRWLPAAYGQVKRDPALQVPRKVLGKTKQKVPILLFGGSVDLDRSFDPKLAAAYRYGVDYFDAAQAYGGGTCEAAIGSFLRRTKLRKDIWLTTKSMTHDVPGFEKTVAGSLKDLNTDYIDLYFLHALQETKYLDKAMEKSVAALKKAGKIRFFGFSCHHGNVAELLEHAAKLPWIDAIMFRYNFRTYGDKALNKAMDAAHKANIGLIAMKTQGSALSFEDKWKKLESKGKFNQHQAVLRAVWADERITAAVSHMDSVDKLRENVAAALNKTKITALELDTLDKYAEATRSGACDGCDQYCTRGVNAPVKIADTLRFLMYHDVYGEQDKARRLFSELPAAARDLDRDFSGANAACPHGVDIAAYMKRARSVLV